METSDGPMGLSMDEKYIYTGDSESPNGIDVHMIKNSEWGAVALLSVSGYGAGSQAAVTSTGWSNGNNTGVYNLANGNWEYTMSLVSTDGTNVDTSNANAALLKTTNKIDSRYYDLYVNSDTSSTANTNYTEFDSKNAGKVGHAITEIRSLLFAYKSNAYGYVVRAARPFFGRGYSSHGGLFDSHGSDGYGYGSYTSRAVVVCGSGL